MNCKSLMGVLLLTAFWCGITMKAESIELSKHPENLCANCKQTSSVTALILQGIQQRKTGNYQQSIATLEQAIKLAQETKDFAGAWQARTFLALTYKLSGNLQKAAQLHEENLAFIRQYPQEFASDTMIQETTSMQALAGVYTSLGNYPKAIEILKQVLTILEAKDKDTASLGKPKLLEKLGANLYLNGNLKEAEKTLFSALEAHNKALKVRLDGGSPAIDEYEAIVSVLRWLQQVLADQNRADEALELAELGRSRAFVGLLASRLANNPKSPTEIPPPNLNQIKQIAKEQNSTLVQYSLIYKYDPDLPLQFSNYQDIPVSGLLVWVIKPTGEVAFRKVKLEGNNSELTSLIKTTRESIGVSGRGIVTAQRTESSPSSLNNEKLQQLYQILIRPIAELLPKDPNQRVTFIPQDLLFLVPFAALQDGTGKYLIEQHTILTAPSIQVLDLTRKQQKQLSASNKNLLIVGNPIMPILVPQDGGTPEELSSLPGAEREANAIAKLFNSQALIGDRATTAAVQQRISQARIIHLATHGILDDTQGYFSSLALAPSQQDKGFFTAREVISLKLNAELVVLSACDTGKGKITGDGVLGLSRSFISAGTPSVIVSLWSVPDAPTAELMMVFYENIKKGLDKAQALRNAMLEIKKQHPNPRDWAAFTLIGEADVSQTLASVSGEVPASNATIQATASRYTVFPLPDIVKQYTEFPSSFVKGEVDVVFSTSLTMPELITFYRQAFTQKGLTEEVKLTRVEQKDFQLVFKGAPNDRKIVIQVTDMSDKGYNERTVSIRYE